jgi:hypothetical protein
VNREAGNRILPVLNPPVCSPARIEPDSRRLSRISHAHRTARRAAERRQKPSSAVSISTRRSG